MRHRRAGRDRWRGLTGLSRRSFGCVGAGAVTGEAADYPIEIAAFWNSATARYLDFNDWYPPIGHLSDMIGVLDAASRSVRASGRDLLAATAVAYEVFARFSETILARRSMSLDCG